MKKQLFTIVYLCSILIANAQQEESEKLKEQIAATFHELKAVTAKHHQLWGKDLYGPIMLIEPKSRKVYSNIADSAGVLSKDGNIYTGILPNNINIANTALDWNKVRWAMIMLPLPTDEHKKTDLLIHELFHLHQPSLGFTLFNTDNPHLNEEKGRIYLRLELEALRKAILADKLSSQKKHLSNALLFRKFRHTLFAGADSTENMLELNEGLAEYTAISSTERKQDAVKRHFETSIDQFLSNPSFVRSFAYQTIPIYGYLLDKQKKYWNKEINTRTDLTNYLIHQFKVATKKASESAIEKEALAYNGSSIFESEKIRAEKIKQQKIAYLKKFVEDAHFDIAFEKMNVSFDPRNIFPLENKGTVYPNIRVSDQWGILTVENGALMSPNWNKISISAPLSITPKIISGDGWKLELTDGYEAVKEEHSGNYKLRKMKQ